MVFRVWVLLGASGGGPGRPGAPLLDQLADEWNGKVRVAKLDVDSAQQLAIQYQVSSIPTFILFSNIAEPQIAAAVVVFGLV